MTGSLGLPLWVGGEAVRAHIVLYLRVKMGEIEKHCSDLLKNKSLNSSTIKEQPEIFILAPPEFSLFY